MQTTTLILSTLLTLACTGRAGADKNFPTVAEVIDAEGQLTWSDGSSYYQMSRDGKFVSGPLGMGGRTIEGRWKASGNFVTVDGIWRRVTGRSTINNFRRMKFGISPTSKILAARNLPMGGKVRFRVSYFDIEELVQTPSPSDGTINRSIHARHP